MKIDETTVAVTPHEIGAKIGDLLRYLEATIEGNRGNELSPNFFENAYFNPSQGIPAILVVHRRIFGGSNVVAEKLAAIGELPRSLSGPAQWGFWFGYYAAINAVVTRSGKTLL